MPIRKVGQLHFAVNTREVSIPTVRKEKLMAPDDNFSQWGWLEPVPKARVAAWAGTPALPGHTLLSAKWKPRPDPQVLKQRHGREGGGC